MEKNFPQTILKWKMTEKDTDGRNAFFKYFVYHFTQNNHYYHKMNG
jgi:hypothetical protein